MCTIHNKEKLGRKVCKSLGFKSYEQANTFGFLIDLYGEESKDNFGWITGDISYCNLQGRGNIKPYLKKEGGLFIATLQDDYTQIEVIPNNQEQYYFLEFLILEQEMLEERKESKTVLKQTIELLKDNPDFYKTDYLTLAKLEPFITLDEYECESNYRVFIVFKPLKDFPNFEFNDLIEWVKYGYKKIKSIDVDVRLHVHNLKKLNTSDRVERINNSFESANVKPSLHIYYLNSPIDSGWNYTNSLEDIEIDVNLVIDDDFCDVDLAYANVRVNIKSAINFIETQAAQQNGELNQVAILTLPTTFGDFNYGLVLKFENNGNTFVASPYELNYLTKQGYAEYLGCTTGYKNTLVNPTPPVYSIDKTDQFIEWNGLYCRSTPEKVIAQELERRKIPFLLNAGGRFNLKNKRVTREPDFLVFIGNGKSAILEVDGEQYHQNAAKDHERDRMFRTLGIQVERFTATQCVEEPSEVVSEFLKLVGQ